MKSLALLLVPAAAVSIAAPAGATVFNAFTDTSNGTSTTITETVDGLTLTADAGGSQFNPTTTGTGLGFRGQNANRFAVQNFESYTVSFDDAGTLDSIGIFDLSTSGQATITITNSTDALVDPVNLTVPGTGQQALSLSAGISFDANDVLTFTGSGPLAYRIASLDATVPEPASAALLAAGGVLMLRRRRA